MTAPTTTQQQPQQSSVGLAMAARTIQLAIAAKAMQDVVKLWPSLDAKRLSETWPGWLASMQLLIRSYHGQSAQAAAAFYRTARAQATGSPTPANLIQVASPPTPEWTTKALGYSAPGMLTRDTVRPNTALSTTLGTTARIVQDGGRSTVLNTVQADPKAVAWYRVTDGHPCAFCALLAGRGMVYKKDTVGFKSHNDCGCSGAPAFSHDQPLPQISQDAAQVYIERGSGDALVAFRKAWAEHQTQSA